MVLINGIAQRVGLCRALKEKFILEQHARLGRGSTFEHSAIDQRLVTIGLRRCRPRSFQIQKRAFFVFFESKQFRVIFAQNGLDIFR